MDANTSTEDIIKEKPDPERVRQWSHGDGGLGDICPRKNEPVYTGPNDIPPDCPGKDAYDVPCGNGNWDMKQWVIRNKRDGKILE